MHQRDCVRLLIGDRAPALRGGAAILAMLTLLPACGADDAAPTDAGSIHVGTGGSTAGTGGSTSGTGGNASGTGGMGSGGTGMPASGGHGGGGAGGAGAGGSGGASGSGGSAVLDGGDGDDAGDASGDAGNRARTYSTDRSNFFGESRCDALGALLCEDFESDALDTSVWRVAGGSPVIDGTHPAARGSKSMHFSTSGTGESRIETTKIFPVLHNRYYGRMFVYFDALPTAPQSAHWTIVGAKPAQDDNTSIKGEIRVGGQYQNPMNRWGVGTDGGPTGDWTNLDEDPKNAVKTPTLGQWMCIEWMHDGEHNQTRFWWDGVEHPSLDTTRDVDHDNKDPNVPYDLPTFGSVWFGFWNYFGTPASQEFNTWIDEIALDDERIGCDS